MKGNKNSFIGCLLGLAIGDALGAPFEGQSRSEIDNCWDKKGYHKSVKQPAKYTDDTHMALSVTESLVYCRGFSQEDTAEQFVSNFRLDPRRGFSARTARMLKEAKKGLDLLGKEKKKHSNGAAMRVAPIGLFYFDNEDALKAYAIAQAEITHEGEEAVSGAVAIAYAVALALKQFSKEILIEKVADFVHDICPQMANNIRTMTKFLHETNYFKPLNAISGYAAFRGPSSYAIESVPMAILFSNHVDGYFEAIKNAVLAGGDTDTVAAMTGAIAGAGHGLENIPRHLFEGLESGTRGKDYIMKLASDLFKARQQ